jgi:hypothetical protein
MRAAGAHGWELGVGRVCTMGRGSAGYPIDMGWITVEGAGGAAACPYSFLLKLLLYLF